MTQQEKTFYCICIQKNAYRYTAYGREANRTLVDLEVPTTVPKWVFDMELEKTFGSKSITHEKINIRQDRKWKFFRYEKLFDIKKGKRIVNEDMINGAIPCVRPIKSNNGVSRFIDIVPNHKSNTITINYNGNVGEAFYQPLEYFALDDINILYPKFSLNVYVAMFLITLIKLERYRYNFGRKWKLERMNKSTISLPVDENNDPDWQFMEDYIKSLPYSSNLKSKIVSS